MEIKLELSCHSNGWIKLKSKLTKVIKLQKILLASPFPTNQTTLKKRKTFKIKLNLVTFNFLSYFL